MEFTAKYGVSFTIQFPVIKAGSIDFAVTGDWTPATGDTKISKDGGDVANTSNNPAAVGGTGSALWELTITPTEMEAARVTIQIVDSATKAVEDQAIVITTYGNSSAQHKFDFELDVDDLASAILKRDVDLDEATAAKHSLLTAILGAVSKIEDDGAGNIKIYRTDGVTVHLTRAVTGDASLTPVKTLDLGS